MVWTETYQSAVARLTNSSNSIVFHTIKKCYSQSDVFEITLLISRIKRVGDGSNLLQYIHDIYSDAYIVLVAEPMFTNFKEYRACSREDYQLLLQGLVRFYERNGFKNINNIINCSCGVAMLLEPKI